MSDIDHEYTDFPVCPSCGHNHRDWESWNDEVMETECDSCEELMTVIMSVSISFNTKHPTPTDEEVKP